MRELIADHPIESSPPGRHEQHLRQLRFQGRRRLAEGGSGARRVRPRGQELRHHERPDERRRASPMEGRGRRAPEPTAGRGDHRLRRRHRRHGPPLRQDGAAGPGAARLPDNYANAYVISFGIRNVTDIDAALREARRVLKPGGRFLCLEFSRPVTEALRAAYDAYSFKVIPEIGARVANDRESYQYLVESIRRFPDQKTFAAMIGEAG